MLVVTPEWLKSQNNDRWRAGSIKNLSGDVTALVCFIQEENNKWTDVEKDQALANVNVSNSWLEEQAGRYDVLLNIKTVVLNDGVPLEFMNINNGRGTGKERVDWVYRVLIKEGYKNSKQAYRKLKRKYHSKQLLVIVMTKEYGRSYSMRYASGYNKKKYFTEGMIYYISYQENASTPAASIAHEVLHLCGAWDLYTTYAQTSERQSKASELFPNDIMFRVDHNISSLNVDALTAWLVGWNTEEHDIFEWFRPADFKP